MKSRAKKILILEIQLKLLQETQDNYLKIARNEEGLNEKIRTIQAQLIFLKNS